MNRDNLTFTWIRILKSFKLAGAELLMFSFPVIGRDNDWQSHALNHTWQAF